MLKLKLQYFGHLMGRTDSLEKTLMLGKIEGRRIRGWQRMGWLDDITDAMHMSLSKLQELMMDRESWYVALHRVTKLYTTERLIYTDPLALLSARCAGIIQGSLFTIVFRFSFISLLSWVSCFPNAVSFSFWVYALIWVEHTLKWFSEKQVNGRLIFESSITKNALFCPYMWLIV